MLCVCFVDRCLSFCTFLLAIVLSVLLRFSDFDYPLVSSNSSKILGEVLFFNLNYVAKYYKAYAVLRE
jgi:hypothetical protein